MLVEQEVTMPNNGQNVNVKQKVDSGQTLVASPSNENTQSTQSDADKVWELEKQLHEQYAINNNAHTSSFISFVVSLLALFGTLGYVFVETPPYQDVKFGMDIFLIFAPIVSGILLFLASLCVQIGYAQRRDQIIIEKFRKNYGLNIYNKTEGKGFRNFLPDYYNMFYWLFWAAQIVVILLTILKICCISGCVCDEPYICFITIISIILQLLAIGAPIIIRMYYYRKYGECF